MKIWGSSFASFVLLRVSDSSVGQGDAGAGAGTGVVDEECHYLIFPPPPSPPHAPLGILYILHA